jgi:hypothetical protein
MSRYFQHPTVLPLDITAGDLPPVPLACGSAALWQSDNATMWSMIARALGTNPTYITPSLMASLTPSSLSNYSRPDRFTLLATFVLHPSPVDGSAFSDVQVADVQRDTQRFVSLYGNCALTNTYLTLRYTPLHDLLAVSGDTWVLGRKLDPAAFAESQRRLKEWRASHCAHTATGFAARALVSFLNATSVRQSSSATSTPTGTSKTNTPSPVIGSGPLGPATPTSAVATPTTPSTPSTITVPVTFADQDRSRIMTSHHWSMYVCALVCWAFGHHAARRVTQRGGSISAASGTGASLCGIPPPTASVDTHAAGMAWLREMASMPIAAAREQKEARAAQAALVPGVVRHVLETDEEMPLRSWLFVEVVGVLRKLE